MTRPMKVRPPPCHAQFAMQALLASLGITRKDVSNCAHAAPHGRELLVSEALRPASTTERWQARRSTKEFEEAAEQALAHWA